MLLLETDYRMYIIFYMWNIKNGTETQVLALYGNGPICLGIATTGETSPMAPRHIMEWCLGTAPPTISPKFVPRTCHTP